MKNNIISFGLLLAGLASGTQLFAKDPMLYFKNKHNGRISVKVSQWSGHTVLANKTLSKGGQFTIDEVDRNTDTIIDIGFDSCGSMNTCYNKICKNKEGKQLETCIQNCTRCAVGETPHAQHLQRTITASPRENKKIYIKFKNGLLTPQKGIAGRTENKQYSILNNIGAQDMLTPSYTEIE